MNIIPPAKSCPNSAVFFCKESSSSSRFLILPYRQSSWKQTSIVGLVAMLAYLQVHMFTSTSIHTSKPHPDKTQPLCSYTDHSYKPVLPPIMAQEKSTTNTTKSVPECITLARVHKIDWKRFVSLPTPTLNVETIVPAFPLTRVVTLKLSGSPGKGLGLYTTHPIPSGTLILSEKPLFITTTYPESSEELEPTMIELGGQRSRLYKSLSNDPKSKDPNLQLPSHKRLLEIFETNCFSLGRTPEGVEELAVFGLGSRFNHSCKHGFLSVAPSNVSWTWNAIRGTMDFVTVENVEIGEELLIDYGLSEPQTRKMLGSSCPVCKYVGE